MPSTAHFLVVLLACAAACSALPAQRVATPALSLGDDCLNATQKHELEEAITAIKIVFKTTEISLDIAIAAEKNNDTKQKLELAERIISSVDVELVSNLTAIVESACGTCDQITHAVNTTIVALEQTLTRIEPDWKNDPLFKTLIAGINDLLTLVEELCPSFRAARQPVTAILRRPVKTLKFVGSPKL